MANRTVIVDNNTWNNTHIATMGLVMGSPEKEAHRILSTLDVDYWMVLSGAIAGYSSDDVAKFLWPVRIAAGVYPDRISEMDFISEQGGYTTGPYAPEKLKNCRRVVFWGRGAAILGFLEVVWRWAVYYCWRGVGSRAVIEDMRRERRWSETNLGGDDELGKHNSRNCVRRGINRV